MVTRNLRTRTGHAKSQRASAVVLLGLERRRRLRNLVASVEISTCTVVIAAASPLFQTHGGRCTRTIRANVTVREGSPKYELANYTPTVASWSCRWGTLKFQARASPRPGMPARGKGGHLFSRPGQNDVVFEGENGERAGYVPPELHRPEHRDFDGCGYRPEEGSEGRQWPKLVECRESRSLC